MTTLSLRNVLDRGIPASERLVLNVLEDGELGTYAIFQTGHVDGNPTIDVHGVFWFPDEDLKEGDLVVLYTKGGLPTKKANKSGKTSHFYYWGNSNSLWLDKAAVLTEVKWLQILLPEQDPDVTEEETST